MLVDRKINWSSGCYDEIELVYEKASENKVFAALLANLEAKALMEAEESCGMLKIDDKPITREMVLKMSEQNKETVMYYLSKIGLLEFEPSLTEGKITVIFSPYIQSVLGCTMFAVLNLLEKLDGTFDALFPKATLELKIPLGAKNGFANYETLIKLLYPWLSIEEVSIGNASDDFSKSMPQPSEAKTPKSSQEKQGFFRKLFGK